MANTVAGPGLLAGPGNFTAVAAGGGGGFAYSYILTEVAPHGGLTYLRPGILLAGSTFFWSDALPSTLNSIPLDTIITISGITAPAYTSLNGTTFALNARDSNSVGQTTPGDSFGVLAETLGLDVYTTDATTVLTGITFNWN